MKTKLLPAALMAAMLVTPAAATDWNAITARGAAINKQREASDECKHIFQSDDLFDQLLWGET